MSGRVRTSIALQIRRLRENGDMSQSDLAARVGTRQSAVSRLENTDYGRASVQTLLDIANALDVALVVKFVSYPEFLLQHGKVTPDALSAETFSQTYERYAATDRNTSISSGLRQKIAGPSSGNTIPRFVSDAAAPREVGVWAGDGKLLMASIRSKMSVPDVASFGLGIGNAALQSRRNSAVLGEERAA